MSKCGYCGESMDHHTVLKCKVEDSLFTAEELRIVKDALLQFTWLNEDGMDAFEYPRDRDLATKLYNKLQGDK